MAYDLSNIVIDRVVRGVFTAQGPVASLGIQKDDILFSINQIQNCSLSCTSESTDAVDALGTPIATFYRSKTAEFSAENALFDMNLLATQAGTVKKVASANYNITVPCFQTIDVTAPASGTALSFTLTHTPKAGTTPKFYVLKGDGTLGDKITISTGDSAAAAGRTAVTVSGTTVAAVYDATGASGFAAGEQIFVMYEWVSTGADDNGAVEVVNSAKEFPVGGKFTMEVLVYEVCNQTEKIYAYIVFPNAKLSPDFDWSKTLFLQAMLRI